MNSGTMPAIVVKQSGGKGQWNRLAFETVPRPTLAHREVLVQVEACSVNRADLLQRRGFYPPPPGASVILGLDFAGFVAAMADNVTRWHAGDRVFGITSGGGYGRYIAVSEDHLVRIPERLSFVEAAAVAEVFFTAFVNLFLEAQIQAGERLLVQGGGSGVGSAAIQLAKAADVRSYITAGCDERIRRCLELGAAYGINYKQEDFAKRILELTSDEGVDVILDIVGGPYLTRHLDILSNRGRLVLIGLMGGSRAEIPLGPVLTKRLRIIGSVLRSRTNREKAIITQEFRKKVIPLLESNRIHPVIDGIYPIHAAEEAHQRMLAGGHFGKIVLTWHGVEDWNGVGRRG